MVKFFACLLGFEIPVTFASMVATSVIGAVVSIPVAAATMVTAFFVTVAIMII